SRRFGSGTFTFLEARKKHPSLSPVGSGLTDIDVSPVISDLWGSLRDVIDEPSVEGFDALLCSSLYKTRILPMPASLARYALMFYVSSLVRYKPSQLDPV